MDNIALGLDLLKGGEKGKVFKNLFSLVCFSGYSSFNLHVKEFNFLEDSLNKRVNSSLSYIHFK